MSHFDKYLSSTLGEVRLSVKVLSDGLAISVTNKIRMRTSSVRSLLWWGHVPRRVSTY